MAQRRICNFEFHVGAWKRNVIDATVIKRINLYIVWKCVESLMIAIIAIIILFNVYAIQFKCCIQTQKAILEFQ